MSPLGHPVDRPLCALRFRYQRQGARARPQLGWVNPVKVPDPRAALEAAFKEKVAHFEVLDGTVELKPPPKRKHRRKRAPKSEPVAELAIVKPVTLTEPYLVQEEGRILLRWW